MIVGFQVLFSGQGRYLKLAEKEGFEVLSVDSVDGKHLLKQSRRKMAGANIFTAETFDSFIQMELKLLDKVQPDAVIHDLQPSMGVSASIAGIPCISITNAYLTRYAIPRMEKLIFNPLVRPFLEPIRRRMASKPFRELSSKYDIPPNSIFKDLLTRADLVLMPDIPVFAPTKNLPDHFQVLRSIDMGTFQWLKNLTLKILTQTAQQCILH